MTLETLPFLIMAQVASERSRTEYHPWVIFQIITYKRPLRTTPFLPQKKRNLPMSKLKVGVGKERVTDRRTNNGLLVRGFRMSLRLLVQLELQCESGDIICSRDPRLRFVDPSSRSRR